MCILFSLSLSLPIHVDYVRDGENQNAIISNNRKRLPAVTISADDGCVRVRVRGACDHKIYIKCMAHQAPMCAIVFGLCFLLSPTLFLLLLFHNFRVHIFIVVICRNVIYL